MAFPAQSRTLARECITLLLAGLLMLSGLASARLEAAKAGDPARAAGFALCQQESERGTDDPDHDCADCCLPGLLALPARLAGMSLAARATGIEPNRGEASNPARTRTGLPWSRGPPKAA